MLDNTRRVAFNSFARAPLWWLALALPSGCAGAARQGGFTYYYLPAPPPEEPCVAVVEPVEHIDQPTPLGFAAVDVLRRLAGQHSARLLWLEPERNDEYALAYGPERGLSRITLDVRASEGQILHRYHVPAFGAPAETECEPGELEIPVAVNLQSQQLALDESFSARLRARIPYRAELSKAFDPAALRGGLSFSEADSLDRERAVWIARLELQMTLWQGGSAGSLRARLGAAYVEASNPPRPSTLPVTDLSVAEPGELARWPSGEACAGPFRLLPVAAPVMGFSARDVLDALEGQGQRELTWSDGSLTELSLEYLGVEESVCQAIGDALELDLEVRARTSDGRVDTRFPVHVTATPEAGAIGAIGAIALRRGGLDASLEAPSSNPELDGHGSVFVDIELEREGLADSGSISLREVDRSAFDRGARHPSEPIATGHWSLPGVP